jgi:nucleoside 2-deoxyribosyltransferase
MNSPRVFISYSHRDADWVKKFAKSLSDLQVDVWLDDWRVAPGDDIRDALEQGLRRSDAIVAVLSHGDEARPNVFFELGVALGMGKRLIPIVARDVDTAKIPFDVRARRFLLRDAPDETAQKVASALKGDRASDVESPKA